MLLEMIIEVTLPQIRLRLFQFIKHLQVLLIDAHVLILAADKVQ